MKPARVTTHVIEKNISDIFPELLGRFIVAAESDF
jgi:hypothetical protein